LPRYAMLRGVFVCDAERSVCVRCWEGSLCAMLGGVFVWAAGRGLCVGCRKGSLCGLPEGVFVWAAGRGEKICCAKSYGGVLTVLGWSFCHPPPGKISLVNSKKIFLFFPCAAPATKIVSDPHDTPSVAVLPQECAL
jgi:hypothetical protein